MKVKLLPKLILFALVVGGGVGLFRHLVYTGVIPRPSALKSLIPVKAEEINAEVINTVGNVKAVDLGSTKSMRPCVDGNTSNCLNGVSGNVLQWRNSFSVPNTICCWMSRLPVSIQFPRKM